MKPFRFSEPASAELADAVRWYEQQRLGLGAELFDAVAQTVDLTEQIRRSVPEELDRCRLGSFCFTDFLTE